MISCQFFYKSKALFVLRNIFCGVFFLSLYLFQGGSLLSKEVMDTTESVEEVNLKILQFLNDFSENSVKSVDKTDGFNYRYKPYFWSPYRFDVYIAKFSKKANDTIVRVEAPRSGEAKIYRSVIEQTLLPEKQWDSPPIPIQYKKHYVYQPVNWISPSLGVLYSGYDSHFYLKEEMIMKSVIYLAIDLVIVGSFALLAQNTKKTKSIQDRLLLQPGENNLNLMTGSYAGPMFAVLAIPRIFRSVDGYYETATQNRFAELGYTIRF
jgi:hypothetical protein